MYNNYLFFLIGMLKWADEKSETVEWDVHFIALQTYGHEEGTCNIPQKDGYQCRLPEGTVTQNGSLDYSSNLGSWLNWQRQWQKKGTLSKDRLSKLQRLVDAGIIFLRCLLKYVIISYCIYVNRIIELGQ